MAVNPSIVSTGQATSHYLQQKMNTFTVIPTVCYLAERLLPFAGVNVPAWATKVSDAAIGSFMIFELGKVLTSPFSFAKDAKIGYEVIWGGKSVADARTERKGDFPRDDNPMKIGPMRIGPRAWVAYRLAAITFKFASSGLVAYAWLKSDAKVHPWLKVAGPVLGAAACVIDFADRESRIRDHELDIKGGNVPAHAMIKDKKSGADKADEALLDTLLKTHWRGDQCISATFFTMKVVAATLALRELVNCESLVGRACQLVKTHEGDIWGVLFIAAVATTATQHLRTGATLTELKERTINKT